MANLVRHHYGSDGFRPEQGVALGGQRRGRRSAARKLVARRAAQLVQRVRVRAAVRDDVQRGPHGGHSHVQHTHGGVGHRQHHGADNHTETEAQGRHQDTRHAHAPGHSRPVGECSSVADPVRTASAGFAVFKQNFSKQSCRTSY